jgi:hypothetical protein
MNRFTSHLALGLTMALLLLASAAAQAQGCPDDPFCNSTRCINVCGEPGTSCSSHCTAGGRTTTCGEWDGNPANDLDSDGVANTSDNCLCTPNADQADCDGDGTGDACDPVNEKWVAINSLFSCAWDGDAHLYYWNVQLYNATVYRNVCDNTTCVKKQLSREGQCCYVCTGGQTDTDCCLYSFNNSPTCNQNPNDQCGQPQCPF